MRSSHLALLLAASLLPTSAAAKAWQGVSPGVSTQSEVQSRFGEPSTRGKLEGRSAVVYKGDQAISGTKQAQFLSTEDGIVTEINVFPAAQLDREAVEGTYGKSAQKTFTDDFRPVWIYRSLGVMVFFGKDGFVDAIRFKAPEGAATTQPRSAAPLRLQPAPPASRSPAASPARPTEEQVGEKKN